MMKIFLLSFICVSALFTVTLATGGPVRTGTPPDHPTNWPRPNPTHDRPQPYPRHHHHGSHSHDDYKPHRHHDDHKPHHSSKKCKSHSKPWYNVKSKKCVSRCHKKSQRRVVKGVKMCV